MFEDCKKVFDGDFRWLARLPDRELVPSLLAATERHKTSPVFLVVLLHYADVDDLPRLIYPELGDPWERRKRFFDEYLPKRITKSRQRQSEYKKVGTVTVRYHRTLELAGVDIFRDDLFSNLLKLPKALKTHEHSPDEVFKNVARMNARAFAAYAEGTVQAWHEPLSTLEEYLHEHERIKSLLSL